MRLRHLVAAAVLALFVVPAVSSDARAEAALRIGVADAIVMAIEESERVGQSENDVARSDYRHQEAVSAWLPHVNADVSYNYYPSVQTSDVAIVPGTPSVSVSLQKDFDFTTSVTLQQTIYAFGKISNAIKAASYGRDVSRFGQDAVERAVSYETARAYITVLLAQNVVEIAKGSYGNAVKTKRILDERYQFGRVPKSDGIKAQADVAARVPALKEAERDLDLATRDLKRLIGAAEEQRIVLTDSLVTKFPRYDIDAALERMFDVEPRLKLLEKTIDMQSAIAKREKSQYYPTLGAYANYSLFAQSDDAYLGHDNFQNLGAIGLNVTIPIWNGNKNWAVYQQALIDRSNAQLELQKANRDLVLQLRNSVSDYHAMVDTYKANREAVRLSRESFDAQQESFRAGNKTLTDLNDSELQLTRNRLSEVLTLYNINDAIARIERLISAKGSESWTAWNRK